VVSEHRRRNHKEAENHSQKNRSFGIHVTPRGQKMLGSPKPS
jgi:hypothetical protein